jgi:hypothetical protein
MKKSVLLVFIGFLLMMQPLFSQVKPFRFGLKVAPNVGWISPDSDEYEMDGSVPGFSWGFISDFTITENYFFGTGFNVSYINGKLNYPHQQTVGDDTIMMVGTMYRKYNLRYIDVPLTLKMKTNKFDKLQFFGQIGFSVAVIVKAKSQDVFSYKVGSSYFDETAKRNISDEITQFKGALVLGGGIEYYIDNSTSVIAGITYFNGLSNILKGDNTVDPVISQKAVPHYVEITLGVIF